MSSSKDAPGMRGNRSRSKRGPLRAKRGDTRVDTLERTYKRDFGVRGDMQLRTLLAREGADSLNNLINGK